MTNLKSFTLNQLSELVKSLGWENYRTQQIFSWMWQKGITDIDQMTNLSKQKREQLKKDYFISSLKLIDRTQSIDGAQKFLFELEDGNKIESVFIPEGKRRTVCVSTQVGCPLQCKICYTGKIGFIRNLKFYEIADQVLQVQLLTKDRITNVVFMGMGEPFLNYEESLKAIETINSDFGLNIGARHITVSTAGIVERIYDFAEFPLQAKLAISLNATSDTIRNKLMPINKKYPLAKLFSAIRYYTAKKKKRVTFEYVLIKGVNDQPEDILRLKKLIGKIPCKINIIPFNPFPETEYQSPDLEQTKTFVEKLYPKLPCVTIRKSKGADILAACGQLAGKIN
ncbi:MAG: 23S rRNA (adenine(2503)-C(2))-methyltransferase RlmN [candidate division WOR-3 bacterium]